MLICIDFMVSSRKTFQTFHLRACRYKSQGLLSPSNHRWVWESLLCEGFFVAGVSPKLWWQHITGSGPTNHSVISYGHWQPTGPHPVVRVWKLRYLQQDEVVEYRRIFKHTTERKGQSHSMHFVLRDDLTYQLWPFGKMMTIGFEGTRFSDKPILAFIKIITWLVPISIYIYIGPTLHVIWVFLSRTDSESKKVRKCGA